MDQLSWSTDKPNPVNAAFMTLTDKLAAADGDEAAMEEDAIAAEVDEATDPDGFSRKRTVRSAVNHLT